MIRRPSLIAAIVVGLATPALAAEDCYDVKVRAIPVDQVPSDYEGCGPGCIIMSWPFFIDLRVDQVIEGAVTGKLVRVLAVQHTYFVKRPAFWLLRKNSAGGYNLVRRVTEKGQILSRCRAGAAPEEPVIRSAKGETLDDLREAGIRRYGHH